LLSLVARLDAIGVVIGVLFIVGGVAMRLAGREPADLQLSPIGVGIGALSIESLAIVLHSLRLF